MFQLSGRSGSRPFSWPSPRLSLPASLRGWQRSAHKHAPEWHVFIPALVDERLCLALVGRSHFCRGWRQTQALWCLCARRQTMTLEPASTHCRFAKSSVKNHLSYHHSKWPKPCAQFLYGRGLKQVDVRIIQGVSVGQKDQNKGLFHLWQEIFQLPRTKRYKMPFCQVNIWKDASLLWRDTRNSQKQCYVLSNLFNKVKSFNYITNWLFTVFKSVSFLAFSLVDSKFYLSGNGLGKGLRKLLVLEADRRGSIMCFTWPHQVESMKRFLR